VQLDKTGIVIRERDWIDTLDLALVVIRRHGPELLAALVAGAAPAAALNFLLLQGRLDAGELLDEVPWSYFVLQATLVMIEIPIATAFITLRLGDAMFLRRRRRSDIARALLGSLPQLVWFTLLLRAPIVLGWLLGSCAWPYLNEVILLERNPFFARGKTHPGSFGRASALHQGFNGEFLAEAIGAVLVGGGLIVSLAVALRFVRGMLTNCWELDYAMCAVGLPCVVWLVVGFFAIVRFLRYLDLRIRREGWEVELKLRAERARLTTQVF
jgi:hypothetical protein